MEPTINPERVSAFELRNLSRAIEALSDMLATKQVIDADGREWTIPQILDALEEKSTRLNYLLSTGE
jgi:hypothetical protein